MPQLYVQVKNCTMNPASKNAKRTAKNMGSCKGSNFWS